jgi:micrococcal nuclease
MYEYNCIIKRVVDGDTVDIDIDCGFELWLQNQRVRLSGIDAPETRTRDLEEKAQGYKTKEFVERTLPIGSNQTLICTQYNSSGKYGRIIGTFKVYQPQSDSWSDLSTVLLTEGLAKPYGKS